MAGCGKLAVLRHRASGVARGGEWDLVVGGIVIRTGVLRWEVDAMRDAAERINAGVEAIVEAEVERLRADAARLDWIDRNNVILCQRAGDGPIRKDIDELAGEEATWL